MFLIYAPPAQAHSPAGRNNIYATFDNGSMPAQIQSRLAPGNESPRSRWMTLPVCTDIEILGGV
jgi:hypothetical protein